MKRVYNSGFLAILIILAGALTAIYAGQSNTKSDERAKEAESSEASKLTDNKEKTDQEWRDLLTDEQYRVTRQCGTEPPFSGKYYDFKGKGSYVCICCGNKLFGSDSKYESGSGWPSFWDAVDEAAVTKTVDRSHGMVRTEIKCSRCDAHLGHVFEDGPPPTGLRYCVNSASLDFVPDTSITADKDKQNRK